MGKDQMVKVPASELAERQLTIERFAGKASDLKREERERKSTAARAVEMVEAAVGGAVVGGTVASLEGADGKILSIVPSPVIKGAAALVLAGAAVATGSDHLMHVADGVAGDAAGDSARRRVKAANGVIEVPILALLSVVPADDLERVKRWLREAGAAHPAIG